ncbi:MAG: multiheme c-type cytochrome [Pseudomonadota bacterium]
MRFSVLFGGLALAVAFLDAGACRRQAPAATSPGAGGAAASARALPAEAQAERGTRIALLYAANLQGEYEHCGCPSHPLGGLVRRATVIDRARAESDGVLIVDAGDMLLPAVFHDDTLRGGALQAPDPAEVERRARLILQSYARMGVNAVLPAERDLGIGPSKLKQLLQSTRVPAVASNLVGANGGDVFPRDRLLTVAGVTVGIFGVVQPQPEDAALWAKWAITATDPTAAAREEVASLRARGAKMIVALLHLGAPAAARKLLEEVPGITWAVQGHAGTQLETPDTVGGAHLVEALTMGKMAGRLDIHVVDGTAAFKDRGERAQVLTIVEDHRRQLVDLERRAAEDKTDQLRDYYKLRREGLNTAIARETELAHKLPAVIRGSWYENRLIPLDESIPDHPAIALLTAAYNAENARRALAGLPVGIALRDTRSVIVVPADSAASKGGGSAVPPAAPTTYAGSPACAGCHQAAWAVFQNTKHARALASLRPLKRDRDPTCVGCHATGYLLPGGTTSIREATLRLKDVGCESCHGPGLEHLTAQNKKDTTRRKVDESVCRGCHTPDQTNGEFAYESFRKAILGPGHGG